jgi:hypothetical protein
MEDIMIDGEQYLNTEEFARMCRTSASTARYWRHIGYGPLSFRVGRRVLYRRSDVESWLNRLADECDRPS